LSLRLTVDMAAGAGVSQSDDVYLEAQIQNITPSPIYLDRVSLEPSSKYSVAPLNADLVTTTTAAHSDLLVTTLHSSSVCVCVCVHVFVIGKGRFFCGELLLNM